MRQPSTLQADWRDESAYAALARADRCLFAWEWLRRDPAYVAQYRGAPLGDRERAREFGLVRFEPPELAVPDARPLWDAAHHSLVLHAEPVPGARADDFVDLAALGALSRLVAARECEHLLLCDGFRSIRLDAPAGTFTSGLVALRYLLEGRVSARAPLLTLRRFLALADLGHFSAALHPREARARRWISMLRAHDALASGAGQREIARILFSASVGERGWRSREPSMRLRSQRLVRSARQMAAGGYRELLR